MDSLYLCASVDLNTSMYIHVYTYIIKVVFSSLSLLPWGECKIISVRVYVYACDSVCVVWFRLHACACTRTCVGICA